MEPFFDSLNDQITITESITLALSYKISVSDTITYTENFFTGKTIPIRTDNITVSESVTMFAPRFLNPQNAYAEDESYAQITGAVDGVLGVAISIDGGATYSSPLYNTYTGVDTEIYLDYGLGPTELWGWTLTGNDVTNTNLRVKVFHTTPSQTTYAIYKNFGFAIGSLPILSGLHIGIEGKYILADQSIYIDNIHAMIHYGTSVLPVQDGSMAYAIDGRKAGETAGNGKGVLVFYDANGAWIATDTGLPVAA
jgi:hypothetical protein